MNMRRANAAPQTDHDERIGDEIMGASEIAAWRLVWQMVPYYAAEGHLTRKARMQPHYETSQRAQGLPAVSAG